MCNRENSVFKNGEVGNIYLYYKSRKYYTKDYFFSLHFRFVLKYVLWQTDEQRALVDCPGVYVFLCLYFCKYTHIDIKIHCTEEEFEACFNSDCSWVKTKNYYSHLYRTFSKFFGLCSCVCACAGACACVCTHECGGQRWMSGVFLSHFTLFLETVSHWTGLT